MSHLAFYYKPFFLSFHLYLPNYNNILFSFFNPLATRYGPSSYNYSFFIFFKPNNHIFFTFQTTPKTRIRRHYLDNSYFYFFLSNHGFTFKDLFLFISFTFSIQGLVFYFKGQSLYTNFKSFFSFFLILRYFIFPLKNKLTIMTL